MASGSAPSTSSSLLLPQQQQQWKELYDRQRERLTLLESEMHVNREKLKNSLLVEKEGSNGAGQEEAMAAMKDFCDTTQRELETEKQEWRSRCLSAEEQLRIMEDLLKTTAEEAAAALKKEKLTTATTESAKTTRSREKSTVKKK